MKKIITLAMYDLIKNVAMRVRRLTDSLIKVKHPEKVIHSKVHFIPPSYPLPQNNNNNNLYIKSNIDNICAKRFPTVCKTA